MELKLGTLVAKRYRLGSMIGRGGMGAVYAATDTKFGVDVALKVSEETGEGKNLEAFQARIQREARIGALLGRSVLFVRAFDWGPVRPGGRSFWIAFDLVAGARSLDLATGTRAQRLSRFARAAQLVGRAHDYGVIHRDVKPSNFLVGADGWERLSDFGLAKVVGEGETLVEWLACPKTWREVGADDDTTRSLEALGSPRFMAPEQFEDAKHVDQRADVYSLGVMLFYALVRRWPYETRGHLIRAHERIRTGAARAPQPSDVDPSIAPGLDDVCSRALAVEPGQRFPSVGALLAALKVARRRPRSAAALPARRTRVLVHQGVTSDDGTRTPAA